LVYLIHTLLASSHESVTLPYNESQDWSPQPDSLSSQMLFRGGCYFSASCWTKILFSVK